MAIIDSYNRKRGVIYVYESFFYWDREPGQPRSKRRLLDRHDPYAGEVIPTGKRNENSAVTLAESAKRGQDGMESNGVLPDFRDIA